MGGPSADDPPDKVKSAARSTTSKRDDDGSVRPKRSLLPFHKAKHGHGNDASDPHPVAGPPGLNTQAESEKSPPLESGDGGVAPVPASEEKKSIPKRMMAGSLRFVDHTRDAIFSSWINVLLVFVPIGIAVNFANLNPSIVFAMNAVAIVPLAGLLSKATESVADRLGDTWGE